MLFAEIFRLAFSSLTANKLRSSLTVLGISVGVFSVIGVMTLIVVMAIMSGFEETLRDRLLGIIHLNANDVEGAMKIIAGTARSMGITVDA